MIETASYEAMSKTDLIGLIETQQKIIQRFYRLLPIENKKFAPGEKLAWAAAKPLIDKEKPNEKGLVRIPIDKIAEQIGMSSGSASRYIMNICERFDATHEVEPYTTRKGQKCNLAYIDPTEPLWTIHPDELPLPPEKERAINGNGKRCPNCNTNNLQVTTRRTKYQEIQECDCCGYRKVTKELDDFEPLQPMEYRPEPKASQPEEPFVEDMTDGGKGPQPEDLFFHPDEKACTSAPANVPLTPPEVSDCSLETLLAHRLGEGQIIVATGDVDGVKYLSKPKDYQPDIQAYLAGKREHIYGSALLDADGKTRYLEWDFDDKQPEHDAQHLEYMELLSAAGAAPFYSKRRSGRGHFGLYFDAPVDPRAAHAWAVNICPQLSAVDECYPIGERRINRLSWPFYQRIGAKVTACPFVVMLPDQPGEALESPGIVKDRAGLTWLLSKAVTPASLIPALPIEEVSHEAPRTGGVLLDKPMLQSPACPYAGNDGLAKVVIAEFNAAHTWEGIVGSGNIRNRRFCASWRGEDKPSVVIDADGYYACDHGRTGNYPKKLDRFEAWCLLNGIDKKAEVNQRIAEYRNRQTGPQIVDPLPDVPVRRDPFNMDTYIAERTAREREQQKFLHLAPRLRPVGMVQS